MTRRPLKKQRRTTPTKKKRRWCGGQGPTSALPFPHKSHDQPWLLRSTTPVSTSTQAPTTSCDDGWRACRGCNPASLYADRIVALRPFHSLQQLRELIRATRDRSCSYDSVGPRLVRLLRYLAVCPVAEARTDAEWADGIICATCLPHMLAATMNPIPMAMPLSCP